MRLLLKSIFSLIWLLAFTEIASTAQAQDTLGRQRTITFYSTFTPTLEGVKMLNFGDNTSSLPTLPRPNVDYQVVDQNLFFPQSSGSLHPVILNTRQGSTWKKDNFIKLGYGNYKSPYGEGSFSMGDGQNSSFTLKASHTSAVGDLPQQKFASTDASLDGVINVGKNAELSGRLFFNNNNVRAYGILPGSYPYTTNFTDAYSSGPYNFDSAKFHYWDVGLKLQLKNRAVSASGMSYSPSVYIERFSDNWSATEYNGVLDVPLTKAFTENLFLNIGLMADLTKYQRRDSTINNNIFYFKPSLAYKTTDVYLKLGAIPVINQGKTKLLPDIQAEKKLGGERFILQAGYSGYYNKHTFKNLVAFNPYIYQPDSFYNTRVIELYGGVRGSLGNHITYSATYSQLTFYDQPLYLNDTLLGNRFNVLYEPQIKDRRISGGLGYELSEIFSIAANVSYNDYYQLDSNARAWGLLPLEVNGSLRYKITNNLLFKSDVNYWTGAWAKNLAGDTVRMKSVVNLNAGLEYSITRNFGLWIQVNNILNDKFIRWNQYENLGINVLGGVIFNF